MRDHIRQVLHPRFLRIAGRGDHIDDVVLDRLLHVHQTNRLARFKELLRGADRIDAERAFVFRRSEKNMVGHTVHDFSFVRRGRIVDLNVHHESVHLRFSQRIGSFLLDGILGRHDQERRLQLVAGVADGDLQFLHALKQRTLHFCRRTVDLICKHQVGEDGTFLCGELSTLLIVDHCSHNIGRKKIGSELDALEMCGDRLSAPIRSGMARLSRATFLRGVELTDDGELSALAGTPDSLVSHFHEGGYRTLRVAASTKRERKETRGIEFDRVYFSWDLGYHGQAMGQSAMPDQYVFDTIKRYEFDLVDQPILTIFEMSSCAAPFNTRPQLLNENELGDGSVFKEHPPVTYPHDFLSLDEPSSVTGHVETTAYSLSAVADFATRIIYVPPKSKKRHKKERKARRKVGAPIYIVVGEHQPPTHAGFSAADQDVVVHVISKDAAQIEFATGFSEGMMRLPAAVPMASFVSMLQTAGADAD